MSKQLQALTRAADRLERARSELEGEVRKVARDYVTAEVVAYSAAHPRRLVTFCSAMGYATLSVQKGGWMGAPGTSNNEYSWGSTFSDDNPPAFMTEIERIAEQTQLDWAMTGSRLLKVRGGVILEDKSHW